ncbi:MAG: hypothetical protein M1825_006289, partial [Sarcosagium campestre]
AYKMSGTGRANRPTTRAGRSAGGGSRGRAAGGSAAGLTPRKNMVLPSAPGLPDLNPASSRNYGVAVAREAENFLGGPGTEAVFGALAPAAESSRRQPDEGAGTPRVLRSGRVVTPGPASRATSRASSSLPSRRPSVPLPPPPFGPALAETLAAARAPSTAAGLSKGRQPRATSPPSVARTGANTSKSFAEESSIFRPTGLDDEGSSVGLFDRAEEEEGEEEEREEAEEEEGPTGESQSQRFVRLAMRSIVMLILALVTLGCTAVVLAVGRKGVGYLHENAPSLPPLPSVPSLSSLPSLPGFPGLPSFPSFSPFARTAQGPVEEQWLKWLDANRDLVEAHICGAAHRRPGDARTAVATITDSIDPAYFEFLDGAEDQMTSMRQEVERLARAFEQKAKDDKRQFDGLARGTTGKAGEEEVKELIRKEVRQTAQNILEKKCPDLVPPAVWEALKETTLLNNLRNAYSRVNFLSPGLGAIIKPYGTSETYARHTTWTQRLANVFLPLHIPTPNPPIEALRKWDDVGDCWCGVGSKVQLQARLPRKVFVDEFVVEHMPRQAVLDIHSAPRTVELWVQILDVAVREEIRQVSSDFFLLAEHPKQPPALDATWVRVSVHQYQVMWPNHVQYFPVQVNLKAKGIAVDMVTIRATDNWGSGLAEDAGAGSGADYTCFYRLRIHGETID